MTSRLTGVTIQKPFVYGNASFALGKEQKDENSHRWTVYLRGLNNEDLSYYIKEVSFALHESFKDPVRVIREPPYEVTELGWGEFSITITVTFHDESEEKSVVLQHPLRLFGEQRTATPNPKKPVMTEKYDEFIFVNPTAKFYQRLKMKPVVKFNDHFLAPFLTTQQIQESEQKHISRLLDAQAQVKKKIDQLRAQLYDVESEITHLAQTEQG